MPRARLKLCAAVAALGAIVAVFPAAASPVDEPVKLRGPASGSVWPVTSTVMLEADTPWFCGGCAGTQSFVVATDAAMSHVVSNVSGRCPGSLTPTCPIWAASGPFAPGTYYWRVVTAFDDGTQHQTDVWSFTVTPHGDGKSTFSDAPADAAGAPDVTAVQVSQTGGRVIKIAASVPGLNELAPDQAVYLALDTDQNGRTGGFDLGGDYVFRLSGKTGGSSFWRWNGASWVYALTDSTVITAGSNGVVATFDRDSIGGTATTGFNFWFETLKGDQDAGTGAWEYAPDASVWNFQFPLAVAAAPTIKTITVRSTPAAPVAGSTFRLRVASLTLSDGRSAKPGRVTCSAALAGRKLHPIAPCAFRIPAAATGRALVIRVSTHYAAAVATRTLRYVVRAAG